MTAQGERRLRVLVVDDNADSVKTMGMFLWLWGHHAVSAHSGPEALAAAKASPPDVVLLDIGLPGMNGYEVAAALGDRPFIIAVTGHWEEEDVRRATEAGIDLHLVKPVDPEQLEAILARFKSVVCCG